MSAGVACRYDVDVAVGRVDAGDLMAEVVLGTGRRRSIGQRPDVRHSVEHESPSLLSSYPIALARG